MIAVFATASGPVDLGATQQRFVRDFPEIDAFLKDPSQREQSFSSIERRSEKIRFVIAQIGVALLVIGGILLIKSGI